MKENLTLTRRTAVALSDSLMLFLGLYGTVFCLVTAFSLPVDYRTITITCLVCAPLFTAVFALPWYWSRVALYLGCAAAVGITAWRWLDLLKLGGLVLARQVVNTFAWALGSSVTLDITALTGETTLGQEAAAITALFLLLTVAVAFWIGWLWQRMRSFSPCVRTNWSPDATRPSTHATSGATARTASSAALRRRSSAGKYVMPRLGTSPGA